MVNFSIAVNDRFNKETSYFFDCVAWGKTATLVSEYLSKGSKIGITGSLRQNRFEVEGQKRSKVEINVEQVEFLDSKKDKEETTDTIEENFPF